jgi:hypothetical protein
VNRLTHRRERPRAAPGHQEVDLRVVEAVVRHIERHVGSIDFVFHERRSHLVHIDVHHVPPGSGRPFHTLVTGGMSPRAMTVPPGSEGLAHGELFLVLPPDWDPAAAWPIELLRRLARYPHEWETWLGCGHTVSNGEPARPFLPDVPFCASLITHPVSLGSELARRRLEDRTIHFYQVIPLYFEEIGFALRHGADALLARFAQYQMSDVVDPGRRNGCRFDVHESRCAK